MREKQYDLAVYVGRFQPFHNGHIHVIEQGLSIADKVLVLCGSSNKPRTVKNPFTYEERSDIIKRVMWSAHGDVHTAPLNDYTYDENKWICEVQDTVTGFIDNNFHCGDVKVVLIGFQRDESSYYLNHFPKWETYFTEEHFHYNEAINGTQLRDNYFECPGKFFKSHLADMISEEQLEFMMEFSKTEEFKLLNEEWNFIKEYKKAWSVAPYAPTFVTTDACIIQSGHVLLIQRKFSPGKGLWALPGGFINENETLFDSCVRELREETGLKVPEKVLGGSCTYSKVFDSPSRSERGRTITHAFLFELKNEESLPRVRGSDDASKAQWIPFSEVYSMANEMYEDHWAILTHMLARTKN